MFIRDKGRAYYALRGSVFGLVAGVVVLAGCDGGGLSSSSTVSSSQASFQHSSLGGSSTASAMSSHGASVSSTQPLRVTAQALLPSTQADHNSVMTFTTRGSENTAQVLAVQFMDIDGDGDLDTVRDERMDATRQLVWYDNNRLGLTGYQSLDEFPRHELVTLTESNQIIQGQGVLQQVDLNNDGLQDIVWGTVRGDILQVLYKQPANAALRWQNSDALAPAQGWKKILRGNVGDAQPALVVGTFSGITLANITEPNAQLREQVIVNASDIEDFWLMDVERDGLKDIVYFTGSSVFWVQNQGAKVFSEPKKLLDNINDVIGIADFDNDGFSELWSADVRDIIFEGSLMTLLQYEYVAGSLLKPHEKIALPFEGYSLELVVGDVDTDGDADVIFKYWRPQTGEVSRWLENTQPDAPLFDRGAIFEHNNIGFFSSLTAVKDFDGDGVVEVVSASGPTHVIFPIPRQTLYVEAGKAHVFDVSLLDVPQGANTFTLSTTVDSAQGLFNLNSPSTELLISALPMPGYAQDANRDSRYELIIQYQKGDAIHSVFLTVYAYIDDGDIDDDGAPDAQDQAPFNAKIIYDNDGDGIADSFDRDDDNDGHHDDVDNAPFNALYYQQPDWLNALALGSEQSLKRNISTTPLLGVREPFNFSLPYFGLNANSYGDTAIHHFVYHPADFNNDGLIDLLATREDGAAAVFINAGSGEFTQHRFGNFSGSLRANVTDVDGDGASDIILGEYFYDDYDSTSQVFIYLNKMAEGNKFVERQTNLSFFDVGNAKQDINGDGIVDVVLGRAVKSGYVKWLQGGVGDTRIDFSPKESAVEDEQYLASINLQFKTMAAGDFNNDGVKDLLAVETSSVMPDVQYRLLLGESTGANVLHEPLQYRAQVLGRFPIGKIALADINGDDVLDVVIARQQAFIFLLSDGGSFGRYRQQEWHTGIEGITALTLDDIDGDGDADIIVKSNTHRDEPTLTHWFENTSLSGVSFKSHFVHRSFVDEGSHAFNIDRGGIFVDIFGDGMKNFLFNTQPSGLPAFQALNTEQHAVAEGTQLVINHLATDGDNNTLNYALEGISPALNNAVSINKSTGIITFNAPNNGDQQYHFWLTVDDGFSQLRRYFNIMVYRDDGDADNDGTPDGEDAFPFDPNETLDTDGDGMGNHQDTDDDGDLVPDVDDAEPLYARVSEALQWVKVDEIVTTDNAIYSNNTMGARSLEDKLWLEDINGDGAIDVIAEERNAGLLYFENKKQPHIAFFDHQVPEGVPAGFSSLRQYIAHVEGEASEASMIDFNNDGIEDELYFSGSRVQIVLSRGSLVLRHEVTNYFSYNDVTAVQAVDIDADGKLDIVVANATGDLAWFKNEGGAIPIFTRHNLELEYSGSDGIAIADIDGDGDQDIVHAPNKWFENDGSDQPNFIKHVVGKPFYHSTYATVTDLNNDGELEILGTHSRRGPYISWYTTAARSVMVAQGVSSHAVVATEPAISGDGVPIIYSITMGPDAALFDVSQQGDITFVEAPDYANPADRNRDNVYDFWLTASNGFATLNRRIHITVMAP